MKPETKKLIEEAKEEIGEENVQLREELKELKKSSGPAGEKFGLVGVLSSLNEIPELLTEKGSELDRVKILARSWHSTVRELQDTLPEFENTYFFILILDPESRYVKGRVEENPYDTIEKVRGEIEFSLDTLTEIKKKHSLDNLYVKTYDVLPIFRINILDDLALFSYYPKSSPGTSVPVFKIKKKKNSFFSAMDRYFEYLWRTSKEIC